MADAATGISPAGIGGSWSNGSNKLLGPVPGAWFPLLWIWFRSVWTNRLGGSRGDRGCPLHRANLRELLLDGTLSLRALRMVMAHARVWQAPNHGTPGQ